ncbi:hypothetical protein [Methanocaldococcus jannaschii]|nr:hypothetical protein [Methanocaldococcus jannaschii]
MQLGNAEVFYIAMGIYLFLLFAIAFMTYRWVNKEVKPAKT